MSCSFLVQLKVEPQGRVIADPARGWPGGVLKPSGGALIKVCQGAGFPELAAAARRQFKSVRALNPAASRGRDAGICLLASGLRLV
jgi:23S rRNA U2552 (ribose-2'-O)-methylase RlmE/FtsJ